MLVRATTIQMDKPKQKASNDVEKSTQPDGLWRSSVPANAECLII